MRCRSRRVLGDSRQENEMDVPRIALIADDDEFFRIALAFILRNELGFTTVIETQSLDEAIEELSKGENIAIALFDLQMPGMKSAASLAAVRDFHPELKIGVVSASTRRSDILAALAAGINGYVPKGLGAQDLADAIGTVLSGAVYVPPSITHRTSEAGDTEMGPSAPEAASTDTFRKGLDSLTPRQHDVLILLVEGLSNKEIARVLKLGEGTIKIHIAALFRSLQVRNRQEAAAAGARLLSSGAFRPPNSIT